MKLVALFCLLFASFTASAQEESNPVPRNEINFEHGYCNRGLLGVSYSRNFAIRERSYIGITGGAGVGLQLVEATFLFDALPIRFLTLSPSFQYGAKNKFLSLGIEIKNINSKEAYNGFGFGGFAGFTYNGQKGFLFKLRLGATAWTWEEEDYYYLIGGKSNIVPMGGISFGFSFGNPL